MENQEFVTTTPIQTVYPGPEMNPETLYPIERESSPETSAGVFAPEYEVVTPDRTPLDERILSAMKTEGDDTAMEKLAQGTLPDVQAEGPHERSHEDDKISSSEEKISQDSDVEEVKSSYKDIPKSVKSDPKFQQKLGEVMQKRMEQGEPLDTEEVMQEAYDAYLEDDENVEDKVMKAIDELRSNVKEQGIELKDFDEEFESGLDKFMKAFHRLIKMLEQLQAEYEEVKKSRNEDLLEILKTQMSIVRMLIAKLMGTGAEVDKPNEIDQPAAIE